MEASFYFLDKVEGHPRRSVVCIRASQPQHCWQFEKDNPSLWGLAWLCRTRIKLHPWPPPTRCQQHPLPSPVASKRVSWHWQMSSKRHNDPLLRTTNLEETSLLVVIRKHLSRKKKYSELLWLRSQILWESERNWSILQSGLVVSSDLQSYNNSQSPGEHARWPLEHLFLQPCVLCLEQMERPLASPFRAKPLCPGVLRCWLYSQNWAQIHVIWDRCPFVSVSVCMSVFFFFFVF